MDSSPFTGFFERLRNSEAQSLLARMDEVQTRVTRCVIVVSVIFFACFGFSKYLFNALKVPLFAALPEGLRQLNFTGPMEVLTAYIKISFLVAALIAMPWCFVEIFRFLKPALPDEYKKSVPPFFVASLVLFIAGVSFCYFLMMPTALQFLIGMGDNVATAMITVDAYVGLIVFMLLSFGAVFQLPIVLILLEALGVVTLEMLTKSRRFIFLLFLVISAIVTPTPDPFSQLAMAIPMQIMFEAAVIIIRRKRKRIAASERMLRVQSPL